MSELKAQGTVGAEVIRTDIAAAKRWLRESAPKSREWEGGEFTTFAVALALARFNLEFPAARDLLETDYNPLKCDPPWPLERLKEIAQQAYRVREETRLDEAGALDTPLAEKAMLRELNDKYFVAPQGGNTVVFEEALDPELNRQVLRTLSFDAFQKKYLNQSVVVSVSTFTSQHVLKKGKAEVEIDSKVVAKFVQKPKGSAWLDHPYRRQYLGGLAFLPGEATESNVYNLWRGYAVEPTAGRWPLLHAHVRDVLCGGDERLAEYFLNWLARMFQRPGEPGQVAVVLKGGRGTGKSMFATFLLKIFGQHGIHLTQGKHLVGNFNAHLRDAVLVFANEAFFAGDKQAEGALKGLITDELLTIEAKYQNAITVKNNTHLLIASNESWIVPAGTDERRFFVVEVSDSQKQNTEYFHALKAEAENGGLEAMLFDLLARDITQFDVFDVPRTAALLEQKIQSLRGAEAWLFQCLNRAEVAGVSWDEQGVQVCVSAAFSDYTRFCERQRTRPVQEMVFGKEVRKALKGQVHTSNLRMDLGRSRHWALPGLEAARWAFQSHLGCDSIDWERATEGGADVLS